MQLHPKRFKNENFDTYIARRKYENDLVKYYLKRGQAICKHQISKAINPETKLTEYKIHYRQYRPNLNKDKTHGAYRRGTNRA